jgi:hypothetical protein
MIFHYKGKFFLSFFSVLSVGRIDNKARPKGRGTGTGAQAQEKTRTVLYSL